MSLAVRMYDQVEEFDARGYTVLKGAFPRAQAQAMRPVLQRAIEDDISTWADKPGYIDHGMVHNLMFRDECFLAFMENRPLHQFLDVAFSPTCIVYAYQSSSMPPGGSNYSRRVHVDCPRWIAGYPTNVGAILALDDFTQENGATYMLAGSHLSADAPGEEDFLRRAERVMPHAGDIVVFNARLWHMGGENKTAAWRHAVTMNICRAFMKQRFDFPRMVTSELLGKLSPKGQAFLGMNARVPTSLDEYYVPESDRLYKSGQG